MGRCHPRGYRYGLVLVRSDRPEATRPVRSFLAFLKNLVLPAGVTSGIRIELIGTGPNAGRIDMYDATNQRVLSIDAQQGGILVSPDEADGRKRISLERDLGENGILVLGRENIAPIVTPGRIGLFQLGSYTAALRITTPTDDAGADQAELLIASEDVSGGVPSTWRFRDGGTDIVQIDGGADPEIWVDHPSVPRLALPRGLVATTGNIGANEGPYTTGTQSTSLVLDNMPTVAGREYLFVTGGVAQLDPNVGAWQLELTINGSVIGNMTRLTNQVAGTFRHPITGWMRYVATATGTTDDFGVFLDERTGTADLTLIGGATLASPPMFFECYDMGVP
jgi:hypothetical protein